MKTYRVIISSKARASLDSIFAYLKENSSIETARKVKNGLISFAKGLDQIPKRHAIDYLFSTPHLEVRSMHIWHYKILYTVYDDEVLVLRFFHTSRNPSSIELE